MEFSRELVKDILEQVLEEEKSNLETELDLNKMVRSQGGVMSLEKFSQRLKAALLKDVDAAND